MKKKERKEEVTRKNKRVQEKPCETWLLLFAHFSYPPFFSLSIINPFPTLIHVAMNF
jgi:hypothetical protein